MGEAGIRRLASHSDGPFGGRRFVFTQSGEIDGNETRQPGNAHELSSPLARSSNRCAVRSARSASNIAAIASS